MLKNSKSVALICGVTSMAVTVIFYLLTFNNIFTIPIRWISLIFLIFTEVIGTVKAISIEKTILGIANIIASIFHLGIVLVMSIIFVNFLPLLVKSYILLNILTICILLIINITIIRFKKYLLIKNNMLSESQSVVNSLYSKAKSLLLEYKESTYRKDLEEILEMLQYSDNSALSNDETVVLDKFEELSALLSQNDESVQEKISDIKKYIRLRSLKIKGTKRGNY